MKIRTSDDTFVPPQAQDIPDYEADPAHIVEIREQKLVNVYHFNLQGNTVMPANALTTALVQAGVVTHNRDQWFDLLESCDDEHLTDEQYRASICNTLAWTIDTMAINVARSMFFRDYKESREHATEHVTPMDAYNGFIESFLNTLDADQSGSEFKDGLARDLTQLLALSVKAHDQAAAAASAIGRDYTPRTFQELLLNEEPMPVDSLTRAKLAQVAEFYAESEDERKEFLESAIAKTEFNNKDAHENRKRINPVVLGLLAVAERYMPEDIRFHQLDDKLQQRLIIQVQASGRKTVMRLATYKSIDVIQHMGILKLNKQFQAKLDEALKAFRTPEEDATIKAQQRQAAAKMKDATPEIKAEAKAEAGRLKSMSAASLPNVGLTESLPGVAAEKDTKAKAKARARVTAKA